MLLSGRPYFLVLSALHANPGGISVDELCTQLESDLAMLEVYYILEILEQKGYLTEASSSLAPASCAFWNSHGIDVNRLQEVLSSQPIRLEAAAPGIDDYWLSLFTQAFQTTGIQLKQDAVLKVIVTDHYQRNELAAINRKHIDSGQPWLLIKPVGVEYWLGPLFVPGQTGCWECLNQRLEINNPINTFYKIQTHSRDNLPVPAAHIPSSLGMAADQAAIEIAKWLYHGTNTHLEGKILSFDTRSMRSTTHVLVKRPQCPVCGNAPDIHRLPPPLKLTQTAQYCTSRAGGYRERSPEDTLETYNYHISPITGIVRALKPYFSIKGAPVYNFSSGPNTALRSKTLYWLNSHIRSANGGKGKTPAQAKTGALCEAIERYCMTYQGDEPRIRASLQSLAVNGIHPNLCMNFSDRQYHEREETNRQCSKLFALVPIPFDSQEEMEWSPVYSLTEQRFKYMPTAFCYTQYPAEDESKLFSYPDSNGCAAGNTIEEAILQGFLELVERDSVAIWWYNRVRRPGVDLDSFEDPYFSHLTNYYESIGRRLYVLDISADLGIPAFAAVSYRPEEQRQNIMFGFGAHVDAKIAIERALVELNQLMPIAEAPGTDRHKGRYLTQEKTFTDWLNDATMDNQPHFAVTGNTSLKAADQYPALCEAGVHSALQYCLERAGEAGLETLVLDLTRPDVELPVARVFVPGLRHFWKRLAPGRLYDVPVKMGWLSSQLNEDDMNPIGLFI